MGFLANLFMSNMIKELMVVVPVHEYNETVKEYLEKALLSVESNRENTETKLITTVVGPEDVIKEINNSMGNVKATFNTFVNSGSTDFCSQVNSVVYDKKPEYFSILEFDDTYSSKWFKMVNDYYYTNEDVSLFLPINTQHNVLDNSYRFENEIIWASSFSNEMGYIDNECLQTYTAFNITGGVFNGDDFISVGGLKPSMSVSATYEFLLRLTGKGLKVFVVPKEGYIHTVLRENSLLSNYLEMQDADIDKWFRLAKRESKYTEDRNMSIDTIVDENVK